MEKIKSFKIRSLTAEGFKSFSEPRSFTFGDVSHITGRNGLGKTTVADAIAYAIMGVPFFGEQSLDRLYTVGSRSLRVGLTLEAGGAEHTLTRERSGDVTTIRWDGNILRQTDMYAMFGDRDTFLSIFNPLYFIEILGDKGRSLLERCLPPVKPENVLARLPEAERELLERDFPPNIEKLRARLRETEDAMIYIEGQSDLLELQNRERRAAIELLARDISELETKKSSGFNFEEMRSKLTELYARYDEASRDAKNAPDISELENEFGALKAEYEREKSILTKLRAGITCPTCKRTVTEESLPSVKESFERGIRRTLERGRELRAKLSDLERDPEETLSAIKAEVQSLESDIQYGGLEPDEQWKLDGLKKDREKLLCDISDSSAKMSVAVSIAGQKTLAEDTKAILAAAKLYEEERAAMLFSDFKMLNRVSVVLYDAVKSTGEAKSVFKFSYEGRPYKFLSLSEKIKAGLEISELLRRLTDSDYPVFIDNGESVPVIDNVRPSGQILIAQVVKGAELEIKGGVNAANAVNAEKTANTGNDVGAEKTADGVKTLNSERSGNAADAEIAA
jgi:DNA repair exonuclease SbcCD ATPase subunit